MFEQDKEIVEGMEAIAKKVFDDMKESAKAQHEIDKVNFEAVKAESKARHAATVKSSKDQLDAAKERLAKAQAAIDELRK